MMRLLFAAVALLCAFDSPVFAQGVSSKNTSVTATTSGAVTNPTSVLTRPATVMALPTMAPAAASPCVFTATGLAPLNGQTVEITSATTLPGTGQFATNTSYYVVARTANTFELAYTYGAAAQNCPTTAGSGVVMNYSYVANTLIASSAYTSAGPVGTSPTVPNFVIPNAAGGFILSRIRLLTTGSPTAINGSYTNTFSDGLVMSINLYTTPPTYLNGDAEPYAPLTGAAGWVGNFQCTLVEYGDGAVCGAPLMNSKETVIKLASGTAVYWDLTSLNAQWIPIASQTFTVTPELVN